MPRIYRKNCRTCERHYIGRGALYCSYQCRTRDYKWYNAVEGTMFKRASLTDAEMSLSEIIKILRVRFRMKELRLRILKRDGLRCNSCGFVKKEKYLDVNHIKSLAFILRENNVRNLKQAYSVNEVWDENNLETLCALCHTRTNNFPSNLKSSYLSKRGYPYALIHNW